MLMKSFLDQYRWERRERYTPPRLWPNVLPGDTFVIYAPRRNNQEFAVAYSADDAQKIVDALNRVPVAGPVEDEK